MRSSVRFPLHLPIDVKDKTQRHQAETTDISAGGVLFHVNQDMKVGSVIEFTIALPGEVLGSPSNVRVNCVGRVVRCSVEGGRRAVAAVIDEYHFERS